MLPANRSKKLSHHLLRVGFSRAAAQAVVFLTLPLLSRLYNPYDFGVWALIQSTALLFGSIATLRFELAVVLPKDHNEACRVLCIGLGFAILLSIICMVILPWVLPYIFAEQKIEDIKLAEWTVPLIVLFAAANQLGLAWCTRTAAFGIYGGSQLLYATGCAAIPTWFSYHPPSVNGLVLGTVLSFFLVQIGLWVYIFTDISRLDLRFGFSWQNWIELLFKYHRYPIYMTPYTVIGAIRDRILFFFMGHYGSAAEVGLYSMAQRLTNAPNNLVASTIRPVFFQFAVNQEKKAVQRMVNSIMMKLVVLIVPPITFYFFYPEQLLAHLLGHGWVNAAPYTMILIIPMIPMLLGNWMDRYLDVLGLQRMAFLMETLFSLAAVATIILAFRMDSSVRVAVSIQAIIMAVYLTVWIIMVFRAAGMPIYSLFHVLINAACISIISAIIVWAGDAFGGMLLVAVFLCIVWIGCIVKTFRKEIIIRH